MWTVLDRTGFIEDYKNNIYFSVPDAVTAAINDPDEYPLQEVNFLCSDFAAHVLTDLYFIS